VDPKNLLETARNITNNTLREVLDEVLREASSVTAYASELIDHISDYTLRGGKRLRAFLVLTGYWAEKWGSGNLDTIRYIMAAIEFMQSYFLAHDDIMDRDTIRRGGPTVHVMFEQSCRDKSLLTDCKHYGLSQAILGGDYLESLVTYSFYKSGVTGEDLRRLIHYYTRGLRLVSYGQFLDVLIAGLHLEKVTEKDVITIHKYKTASYTIELPLYLGAIAAGSKNHRLFEAFTAYAYPAGIAFQIQDDILGLYGDPKVTGKPVGSDVREKKKTLLVVKAYEWASEEDKEFLRLVYDEKKPEEISEDDILRVQEIVRKTGSLDYSVEYMQRLTREARVALDKCECISSEAREVLEWLLELIIKRKK